MRDGAASEVGARTRRQRSGRAGAWRWWCDRKAKGRGEGRGPRTPSATARRTASVILNKKPRLYSTLYMDFKVYAVWRECQCGVYVFGVRSLLTSHFSLSASERFLRAARAVDGRVHGSSQASASHSARTGATCVVTIHLLGQRSCLQCIRYGRLVHY